jgi:hypothetical protein
VLTPVDFDDQVLFDADKIDDVVSQRVLTAKLYSGKLFGA